MRLDSFEEIIRYAIREEINSASLYRMFAGRSAEWTKKMFEELAQDDLSGQPEADEMPLSTITYVSSVNNVDEVRSLLLVFPHDRLGDEDVTLKVPMGGKIGLIAKFRLSEMLVAGVRKF